MQGMSVLSSQIFFSGIILTMIGAILSDFCYDALQMPCRALMVESTKAEDHTKGLSMFMVVAGAAGALCCIMAGKKCISKRSSYFQRKRSGPTSNYFCSTYLITQIQLPVVKLHSTMKCQVYSQGMCERG